MHLIPTPENSFDDNNDTQLPHVQKDDDNLPHVQNTLNDDDNNFNDDDEISAQEAHQCKDDMFTNDDDKPIDELHQNDELSRLRAENKRLQSLLQEAKSEQSKMKHEQLMIEQLHDDKLEEITARLLKTEKENADLSSIVHKQDEIINTLNTGQRLLDAGYTATLKSYAQTKQDPNHTRVHLNHVQNKLDTSKVHIMIQDEEHAALLQFFDKLKHDIKVRDDIISRLESKLQVQDKVQAQQEQ